MLFFDAECFFFFFPIVVFELYLITFLNHFSTLRARSLVEIACTSKCERHIASVTIKIVGSHLVN